MKISQDESTRAAQISPAQPPVSLGQVTTGQKHHKGVHTSAPAAQVEVSAQAQALSATKSASKAEAAQYLPAVQAAPETRDDLVSKLKAQVESGSYHVSGTDIADQILRRSTANRIQ